MKKTFRTALLAATLAGTLFLSACGGAASSSAAASSQSASTSASVTAENVTLTIGASPAPHAEILEQVAPLLAKQGITLDIKVFNDYVIPNTAVDDGSLDANYFQHLPYLEDFNLKNGTDIVSAAAIHFEPLGIYPGKTATIEDLTEGALVGIPNDTTNEARALYLLEAQGLIKLKEGVGFEAVPSDIVENPLNLTFKELEAAQLPASLPDFDIAVINGNYAVGAGLEDKLLVSEDKDSDSALTFANIIAVRSGDENRPEIKALVEALQSEEIRQFIEEQYKGVVVPVF